MLIRDACKDDLAEIVAIYNASIPGRLATADLEPVSVESRASWLRDHDCHARPLWVAVHDHTAAGWLSFQSFYGRPAYHSTAELSIYVAPAFQRQGIGRALLMHAVSEAPRLGLKTLIAFVFGHNEPSLRLFKGLQFEQWGVLPGVAEMDGAEHDLVILGRRIT